MQLHTVTIYNDVLELLLEPQNSSKLNTETILLKLKNK